MTPRFRAVSRVAVALAAAGVFAIVTVAQAQANPDGTPARSEAAGRYADVNGVHLYYEIHGTGKPLILLHGGLGAIEMFGPNLQALARGRRSSPSISRATGGRPTSTAP